MPKPKYDPKLIDPDIEPLIFFLTEQGYITEYSCSGFGRNAEGNLHGPEDQGYIQFKEDYGLCKKVLENWERLCEDEKQIAKLRFQINQDSLKPILSWKLKNHNDRDALIKVFHLIKLSAIRERNY